MESNILNPTYRELMAIEKYRNSDTGRFYSDKRRNNWIKAIINICNSNVTGNNGSSII